MKLHPELEKMAAVILDLLGEYDALVNVESRSSDRYLAIEKRRDKAREAREDFKMLRASLAVQALHAAGIPEDDAALYKHVRQMRFGIDVI